MENILSIDIVKQGNFIYWTARTKGVLTEEQAIQLQTTHGYNPMGYSFDNFRLVDLNKYSWVCYSSCD